LKILDFESQNDPNSPGFFIMVEGSRIDHALHDNDPSTAAREALEYDKTWKIVQDFVSNSPRTSVVSVADHETGGLTLGRPYNYGAANSSMFDWFPENLLPASASSDYIYNLLRGGASISDTILQYHDVLPTPMDIQNINNTLSSTQDRYTCINNIGRPISNKAYVNWANGQHTGVDVNVYSIGPISNSLRGNIQNTDVCKEVAKYLNLDMTQKVPSL